MLLNLGNEHCGMMVIGRRQQAGINPGVNSDDGNRPVNFKILCPNAANFVRM